MSTNNLNTNNNASQTLFRFATSRNAELSDPKNLERRFIFRKDTQKGVFDQKLNASTSLQKLCEDPSSLPLTVETEQTLKAKDTVFYDLAVWVARNKATASKAEFDAKIKEYRNYLVTTNTSMLAIYSGLWDNLVYQVVTQKDFYAKETLVHFLHLNHILSVYTDGVEDVYNDVIKAKVVLPKELFKVNSAVSSTTSGTSRMADQPVVVAPKVAYNDKNMKFAEAKMRLMENQKLSEALNRLERVYLNEYQENYQRAYDSYQAEINPIQKEYQNRISAAENRKKYLEGRIQYLTKFSIARPDFFIKDERSQEELRALNEELSALHIPLPEVPEFNFEFRPELSVDILMRDLNQENTSILAKIFGTASFASEMSGITTFNSLNEIIAQNNQNLQQQVLNNTIVTPQVSTSVGGVVVPVNNSLNTNGSIPYSVKTYNRGNSDWFIMLTVENYTHNIVSGSYKVTINGTDIQSTNVFSMVNGVNALFYNGTTIPASQTANTSGFVLQGEVVLDDGKTYSLSVTLTRDSSEIDRILKQGVFKGSAVFTPVQKPVEPENPENPTTPTVTPVNSGAFIPSGFGMKNIGVADYLKVEQSLQGYIEGEVAHIENVMARERREKSTKKTSKSEITTMESSDTEKEQLRDTSSTDRFELQNEISKAIQDVKDANVSAYVNGENTYPSGSINYGVAGGFSTHNSKEENVRQAMTQAKEITQKATDRVVTKVHKERTEKMIEEFEETNIHEFDNRKGDKHVVGVYRWVDKVYKNQIYNYGKRMMFEFMIPEPAKLHSLGMKISKNAENMLVKPIDPRESAVHQLKDFTSLNDSVVLKYWLSKYNVIVDDEIKPDFTYTGKSFAFKANEVIANNYERYGESFELEIEEGYETVSVTAGFEESWDDPFNDTIKIVVGDQRVFKNANPKDISGFRKTVPISYSALGHLSGSLAVKILLKLTDDEKIKQKQALFNKIIAAYEKAKAKYDQDLAAVQAQGVEIKGSNPGFYRQIENTILRRNCISYMIDQNPSTALTFGKNKYYKTDNAEESFLNTEVKLDSTLDQYASFVKFMEQAFEWEIMSYYFYPYYWGNRNNWDKMYQFDDNDPTFRAFMQSGMARVIVTVRPGFEEAVRHYLATGQIWNGGEVPVIDDPLFLSIVDEMRKTEGEKYGKAWATRLPTALTLLQAQSIGLNVTKALPFDDNLSDYEDPTKVPQSSQIVPTDAQMGGETESLKVGSVAGHIEGLKGFAPEIMLKNKDKSPVDFTNPNDKGDFWLENIPVGKYEICLDENDDFDNQFDVLEGKVTRVVEVKENATTEVNLVVKKI